MSFQSEAELENWLINELQQQFGYSYYKQIEDKETLEDNFRTNLYNLNKEDLNNLPFTDTEFDRILTYLKDKSVYKSAKQLRDKYVLEREDGSKVHIKFLDYDDYSNNKVQVANQITVINKYETRFDVTLLINGLPLIQLELKKRGIALEDAFNQTERYRRHAYTGLFKYIQVFIITNGTNTKYYANSDNTFLHSSAFYWTDEENNRINDIKDFIPAFLNPDRLFKMLHLYTVLNDTERCMMIMRPYQVYATELLLDKALSSDDNGYIWHTTGAGKTLTCWKCAKLLITHPEIKKVFFLIDRRDLDTQTSDDFNEYEKNSVDRTDDTKALTEQTKDKNRKLIITTIQKMSHAINDPKYKSIMEEYANEKVVFLIDECHRSQFGKMHKDVKGFFKKAQYFGFTGTPIFKENAKKEGEIQYITETLFGKPLHQYMIKQAIADGNVLGFKIEYMKTIVAKDSVYEQKLNENEAASSSTEVSAIDTAEAWNDERRIEAVCKNIIQNFKAKTVNKNYNAILATSGVENLIKYYDTFKRLNPDFTFAAVFTYDVNEDAESKEETSQDAMARIIDDYNAKFGTSFKTDTFAEYNKDLSKKFKANKINLLIVVRMYLTGYNSKILNTLYVDKNLVYQDLLQSYSRTNRTEKATKKFGNIVCYRNLKYNTDQALKLYSNSSSTEGIVQKSFEYYLDRLQTALGMLWQVTETPQDAANLQSETEQKKFILAFREVIRLITTLKTFEEFEFDEALIGISEEDFDNYKSQYRDIHKNLSRRDTAEKASILDEVDFQIELLETDVINVDYILTLLKNVDMTNPQQKEKDITEIFDKIKKSANPTLCKKSDLIIAFIQSLIDGLKIPEDLEDRFRSFEEKAKQEEITKFANEHGLTYKELNAVFEEYEFDGILNNDSIKNLIHKEMGFLELSKVVKEIKLFIIETSDKYSLEMAG